MHRQKLVWMLFMVAGLLMLNREKGVSNIIQPAAANDGDPTTLPPGQTCAQCHSGSSVRNATGLVNIYFTDPTGTVSIDSFNYKPNTVYSVLYAPKLPAARYGFQLSVLDNQNHNGGTLSLTNTAKTALATGIGTKYVSHKNADTTHVWQFNWTSPATDIGPVTFYYVFNQANASNTEFGDTIYKGSTVVAADTTTSVGVGATLSQQVLSIYPNPATEWLHLQLANDLLGQIYVRFFALDGTLKKALDLNTTSGKQSLPVSIADMPSGIYLLQVAAGDKVMIQKIVKQ